MQVSWGKKIKDKLTKSLLGTSINDLISTAVNEERKWWQTQQPRNTFQDDTFYAQFRESSTQTEIDYIAKLYDSKGMKAFKEPKARQKLINVIESTGWAPLGMEDAAFRIGSVDELSSIQDACFKKYFVDPMGKSIVMNIQNFTIGKGIKVSSIVPEVDEYLKSFRKLNKISEKEKKMVRSAYIEGEYFMSYTKAGDKVYLRKIVPSRVITVKTSDDDVEDVLAYEVSKSSGGGDTYMVKDISRIDKAGVENIGKEPKDGKYIQLIRYGEEEFTRGQPPMYPVLRYIKHYEDWLVDRMRLNHERAKVVWIRSRTGADASVPANPFSAPKGGLMLEETVNMKYRIESAKLDSGDAKDDGLAILYIIGAGVQLPLHVLTQIASESVYASIKKIDTPFSQMIESNQDMWKEAWDTMYRTAMKLSGKFTNKKFSVPYYSENSQMEAMRLINEMTIDEIETEKIIKEATKVLQRKAGKVIKVGIDEVPIDQIFPQVVTEDPLSVAKVLFLHKKMGIVSSQTASEKAGYNWLEELAKLSREPKPEEEKEDGGSETTPGLTDTGLDQPGEPEV